MHIRFLALFLLSLMAARSATAQPSEAINLQLYPQGTDDTDPHYLLPPDPELEHGNAAVVLLRMLWEQQPFMANVVPKIPDLMELPYDDPRIIEEFPFNRFYGQMERAAYMRDADWHYPLDEEPLVTILLPDVQGLREFAGRGLFLWIGQQIARGDLEAARKGILVQLACARHIARTPLVVNHFVALANADFALDRLELLIQQKGTPNLYWALAMLPKYLGDTHAVLQWDAQLLPRSLPTLADGVPPEGDEAWKQLAEEFAELMTDGMGVSLSPQEGAEVKAALLSTAKRSLSEEAQVTDARMAGMSDEEIVMRWILATTQRVNLEIERAFSLPPVDALSKLNQLEKRIAEIVRESRSPATPFIDQPKRVYLALHRFHRRVKLLQTVEAIRDYAADHGNRLPESLSQLQLPVPLDPFTGKPFLYESDGATATLRMSLIEGVDPAIQQQRVLTIRLAE